VKKAHHIDFMRINTRECFQKLEKIIPLQKLKEQCRRCYLRNTPFAARAGGFSSSINVILPDKEFFRILEDYEYELFGHKISKIEIAEDTFYNTKIEAEKAFRDYYKTLDKKWSSKKFLYTGELYQIEKDGKWYHQTAYFGEKHFQFVMYPRLSKITNQPCLHKEFSLLGASNIKGKTGIGTIEDLIAFNAKETFNRLDKKFIDHCEIDFLKFGKFLKGRTRKRKLSAKEQASLEFRGRFCCKANNIKTYSDLKQLLSKQRKSIKAKRGRKSNFEKKFEKISYGYFKK
jgi:hypothetical protein